MPLISIINKIKNDSLYIGQSDSLEEKICKQNNIRFIGYKKGNSRIDSILLGYKSISKVLKSYKVNAVIASGGFVSMPACLYAIRHKIPLFLLEENVILGDSNKLFYPFCKKLFLAYELDKSKSKAIISGMPLRKMSINNYNESFDILIIGGSLGSKILCDAAVKLSDNYKVCLIAGNYSDDYKSNENLNVISFSNDIYILMKKAKVIIARAGASTCSEIFFLNRPFICIPSMKTKKNHQYYNAKFFSENGACLLCLEKDIDKNLKLTVDNLINNENMKVNMYNSQNKLVKRNADEIIIKSIKENTK